MWCAGPSCARTARRAVGRASTLRHLSHSTRRPAREVKIVEVGPRDGLQNEKMAIPVETKTELVRRLATTGLDVIEAGSFVAPKWVPQMANSATILDELLHKPPSAGKPMKYQWLLPNEKGLNKFFSTYDDATGHSNGQVGTDSGPALNTSSYDANAMPSATSGVDAMSKNEGAGHTKGHTATDSGPALNTSSYDANAMPSSTSGVDAMNRNSATRSDVHEISIFMAATESFSRKNTNCSIAESLERFRPLIARARDRGFGVRAYISVALGCPYEGTDVSPHRVADLTGELLGAGADSVCVADTTGMGTAPRTAELLKTLTAAGIQPADLALHFHDTFGQALVNTLVGLEHGITVFDSAVGGLGGCPYSPGATGNVATEDLIHTLHSLGADTGVDLLKVAAIGEWISKELGRENESRAGKATLARARA